MYCLMKIKEKDSELKLDLNQLYTGETLKTNLKLFHIKLDNRIKKIVNF